MARRFAAVLAVVGLALVTAAALAHAAVVSYPQFSMMTAHSWGEYWAGDQVAGKWGWDPQSPTESRISWGDPEPWPPAYAEKFIIGTSWVLLDGWYGNGTYYTVRVSTEQLGDANCIKQWESWWDNKGAPGTPITRRVDRDQYIARGIGMAFQIQQYYPSPWHADLRYNGVS